MAPIRQAPMLLPLSGWFGPNHASLCRFVQPGPKMPGRVAAFDWDNTCVFGDIGDAALAFQAEQLQLSMPAAALAARLNCLLAAMPAAKSTAALAHQLIEDYCALWPSIAAGKTGPLLGCQTHRRFAAGLKAIYAQGCMQAPQSAYLFAAQLCEAAPQGRAAELAAQVHTSRNASNLPALAPYPEMISLFAALNHAGITPYVISASHEGLVRGAAKHFGYQVEPQHVFGMRPHLADGTYPATYGMGKVAVARQYLPRPPVLCAGDARTDLLLLTAFAETQVRLFVHRPKEAATLAALQARTDATLLVQGHDARTGHFNGQDRSTGYELG